MCSYMDSIDSKTLELVEGLFPVQISALVSLISIGIQTVDGADTRRNEDTINSLEPTYQPRTIWIRHRDNCSMSW